MSVIELSLVRTRKFDSRFFILAQNAQLTEGADPVGYVDGYKPHTRTDKSFSPIWTLPGDETIGRVMCDSIQNAQLMIAGYSFLIDTNPVIYEMIEAAKRLVPNIKFMTTLRPIDLEGPSETEVNHHMSTIRHLLKEGIEMRSRKDCHAKVMLTENEAIISSANWVQNSFEKNPEYGIVCKEPSVIRTLARFLQTLWDNSHFHAVYRRGSQKKLKDGLREFSVPDEYHIGNPVDYSLNKEQLIWTFKNETQMADTLVAMITRAKKSISLFTYILKDNNNNSVGRALLKAAKRGIPIRIFTRAANTRTDHLAGLTQLSELGTRIRGDARNHSKGIITDSMEAAVFTANFEALGMDEGIEVGVYSNRNPFVIEVQNWFNFLFRNATHEFVSTPSAVDFLEGHIPTYRVQNLKSITGFRAEFSLPAVDTTIEISTIEAALNSFKSEPIFMTLDDEETRLVMCSNNYAIEAWKQKGGTFTIEKVSSAAEDAWNYRRLRMKSTDFLLTGEITFRK